MPQNPPPPVVEGYPVLGNSVEWARDPFGFINRLVAEVGDVARYKTVRHDVCVLAHPDHAERVLVSDRDAFMKPPVFNQAFGDGLLAAEGELWKRTRGALDEFFFPQRIASYAETMTTRTEQRIGRWEDGETISLAEEMKALTLEIIFATLFDTSLDLDGDESLREAADNLHGWFTPTSLALPKWVPTPSRRRFKRAVDRLQEEGRSLLASADSESDDMLSALAAMQGDDELTDHEILSQFQTFIFAGHDTTALALTYTLYLLETHSAVRQRFYDEIDSVIGDAEPTMADLGELTVTENVLNEGMRLYPPVYSIPRVTKRDVDFGD
jgi:cytochrome P450